MVTAFEPERYETLSAGGSDTVVDLDVRRVAIPRDGREPETLPLVRVRTGDGVTGYAFAGRDCDVPDHAELRQDTHPRVLGRDLATLCAAGARIPFARGAVEHALWDALGRLQGRPVSELLGATTTRLRAYLTCVWPGRPDQEDVSVETVVATAHAVHSAGFGGLKIRSWSSDPRRDIDVCLALRDALPPGFALMVDRTAGLSGSAWDLETAKRVARGLETAGVEWLEEPLAAFDFAGVAELAASVDIPISGGETFHGIEPFARSLAAHAYDILQPDATLSGGIASCVEIARHVQRQGTRSFLHGMGGLPLAGWLHASAAVDAEWQELAVVTPPDLPPDSWRHQTAVLLQDAVFDVADGQISVPHRPGLGLDVDEDAVERLAVTSS